MFVSTNGSLVLSGSGKKGGGKECQSLGDNECQGSVCSCVSSVVQTIERSEKLIESLELPQEKLSEDQRQLRELLVKYSNVFSLCFRL